MLAPMRLLAADVGGASRVPCATVLGRYGEHVSVERVVSATSWSRTVRRRQTRETVARLVAESPAAVIGERGLSGADPAARAALSIFVALYGAEAGNLALRVLPGAGLYVAGGIAAKLLPRFTDGCFLSASLAKGRMAKLLEQVRVAIVLDPDVGLLGARARAALLCVAR